METKIFISYSHKDDVLRQELATWLAVFRNQGLIKAWFDGNLLPGDELLGKIDENLKGADIILLLLSPDYLASKACRMEMDYAISNSETKHIIPIVIRDCAWTETDCKKFLALPKDGNPVTSSYWESHELAWHNVFDGIKKVIEEVAHNHKFKDDFIAEIQQVEFVTQNKEKPKLDEIFIFPNINKDKGPFEKETVNDDYFLGGKNKSILVRGREFCGKTALARWLFLKLDGNYSPILLDGNDIYKTKNFDEHLKKEFSRQRAGNYENWKKLDNNVVIIDNYHHNISPNIIDYVNQNFVIRIIAMDDEEFMLYFKDEPSITEYSIVTLGQLSLVKQEELIRKWMQLNLKQSINQVDDLDVDKLEASVNNVITVNRIVPRYPFFILRILQAFEIFMPSNYQITAYGHCYQALVIAQLIKKNIKYEDIDSCFNYLKHLSLGSVIFRADSANPGPVWCRY